MFKKALMPLIWILVAVIALGAIAIGLNSCEHKLLPEEHEHEGHGH